MLLVTLYSFKDTISKVAGVLPLVILATASSTYADEHVQAASKEAVIKQAVNIDVEDTAERGLNNSDPKIVLGKEDHTPQWVERYILKYNSNLLQNSHTDHVLAFYYFGSFEEYTIFGMERVKGDDYESHNTVLVFRDSILQGYYQDLTVFPAGIDSAGVVFFPPNHKAVENIDLANGIYPGILFKPEIERFEKGYLKSPPRLSRFIDLPIELPNQSLIDSTIERNLQLLIGFPILLPTGLPNQFPSKLNTLED